MWLDDSCVEGPQGRGYPEKRLSTDKDLSEGVKLRSMTSHLTAEAVEISNLGKATTALAALLTTRSSLCIIKKQSCNRNGIQSCVLHCFNPAIFERKQMLFTGHRLL